MVLKTIKSVCNYAENDDELSCDFNGNKLNDLEIILTIAKSKFQKIENIDFFEFGSQEWNPSHYGPRSGMGAHFMGVGTNLSYRCFDAYSESDDFDANVALLDAYNQAEKEEAMYLGLIVKYKDLGFWEAKKKFESLNKNKDLSHTFVKIRNEEYFKKFYEFYDGVDLGELKKEINKFSINTYSEMKQLIEESKNSLVYSNNVLNSPNLTDEYNFWNIENTYQIHSGSIHELAELLKIDLGWMFSASEGKKFDMKEEFIDTFTHKFDLLNYDVQIQNNYSRYFLFWDASKKVEKIRD